jgi:hypothetical protein
MRRRLAVALALLLILAYLLLAGDPLRVLYLLT